MLGVGFDLVSPVVHSRQNDPIPLIGQNYVGPHVSLTRSSAGTYYDMNGQLSVASANEARFDYHPGSLQYRGLLVEAGASNLIPQALPSQVSWSEGGSGSLVQQPVSFGGFSSALRMESGGNSYDRMTSPVVTLPNGQIVVSALIHVGDSNALRFDADSTVGGHRASVRYDFTTQTVLASFGDFGPVPVFSAEPLSGRWWRVAMQFENTLGTQAVQLAIGPFSTTLGDWLECAFAQIETGTGHSSEIVSSGTVVDRAEDILTVVGLTGLHDLVVIYDDASVETFLDVDLTGGYRPAFSQSRIAKMRAQPVRA